MAVTEEGLLLTLSAQTDKMFKVLAKADAELKRRMLEIDNTFSRSNRRVTEGLQRSAANYERSARQMAAGSRATGFAVGNAANQVGDFAVQVAAGTDPMRAMSQQIPQLLGGFGPLGMVMGAAAAIAIPLGSAFWAMSDSAPSAADGVSKLAQAMEALRSAQGAASVGAEDLLAKYGTQADGMRELLDMQRQVAAVAADRAFANASRGVSSEFAAGRGETLAGYDLKAISLALDEVNRKARETGQSVVDVMSSTVSEDMAIKIENYGDAVAAVAKQFGIADDAARTLLASSVEIGRADNTKDRAAAARDLAQQIFNATDGLRTASDAGVALYNALMEAAASGTELSVIDIASGITAGADAAALLATRLGIAKSEAVAMQNAWSSLQSLPDDRTQFLEDRKQFVRDKTAARLKELGIDSSGNRIATGSNGGGGGGGAKSPDEMIASRLEQARAAVEAARMEAEAVLLSGDAAEVAAAKIALLQEAKRAGLDLDKQSAASGLTLRQEIDKQAEAIGKLTAEADQYKEKAALMKSANQELKDGLLDAIIEGKNFGDVLEGIAKKLARAALEAALFGSGPFAGGGGGGLGGALGGIFGSIFGGARANGGPVRKGAGYLVGETGPEMFYPGQSGHIAPPRQLTKAGGGSGGGTMVQVVNYSGQPAREERSQGPDGREVVRVIVGEEMARGRFDGALRARTGGKPPTARRG